MDKSLIEKILTFNNELWSYEKPTTRFIDYVYSLYRNKEFSEFMDSVTQELRLLLFLIIQRELDCKTYWKLLGECLNGDIYCNDYKDMIIYLLNCLFIINSIYQKFQTKRIAELGYINHKLPLFNNRIG